MLVYCRVNRSQVYEANRTMADDKKELPAEIEQGITTFDQGSLKHTETVEKVSLPTPEGVLLSFVVSCRSAGLTLYEPESVDRLINGPTVDIRKSDPIQ